MASNTTTFRATAGRAFRRILPWALALAVATCTDDQSGPSAGGTGYFSFRPVYGISNSLSQFGIVADSIHITLTRPVNELVLDTTVFFPPDSTSLRLALPVHLLQSPETLAAVVEIKSGGTILFVDSVDVAVLDGPPVPANIPTIVLDYVGPGKNVAAISILPADTTMTMGDTLFFTSSAVDSSAQPVPSFFTAWKTSDTTVARINAQGRLIAPNVRGTVQVIGYTPTGIADTTTVTFAPVPVVITADSGNAQNGQAGDSLAGLFVARVKGADSLGISGIAVRFLAVTAGGAVRDTQTLFTDLQGRVRTRGVLGTAAQGYSYSATVVGTAITRTFTATAAAGAPSAIAIMGGDAQVDSAGRVLPQPLTVRVADAFDNPVTGAKVYWTRTAGTGTVSLDSSTTDGTGLTAILYTLGTVGVDSITATLAGTSASVAFQVTAINGAPATVLKTFGDAQTDTVGRLLTDSLVVIVRSATAQPVVGTPVVWTVLRGGSTSADTAITDAAGRAAVAYTLGTAAGIDSVRAQAGGASATFTATALTGQATTLALVSGDAQTDTTDKPLPLPFVVHATDAFGNDVAGTAVAWARPFGNGTLATDTVLTDGAGVASVGYTLGSTAGTDTITATLVCGCSTVTFTATAVSAAPASIVTVAGDSQSVVVNTAADTFEVLVRDGSNNPIAGAKVNWAFIPAQGAFQEILPAGIQQTFTDSLGVARGIYTAGTSAGTVRVEASIGGLIDSLYVFATPAAPSAIAIQAGDQQTDTIYRVISLPFVARVTDAFGNRIAGATVAYTIVSGSGSLFGDSIPTDLNGDAAVGYLHGGVPGVDTIRATLVGSGAFVDFESFAVPGAPTSVTLTNGSAQTDTVLATLATPLTYEVRDGQGNPVPGATLSFTTTGGLTPAPASPVTDLTGTASVTLTLGDTAGTWQVKVQTGAVADSINFGALPALPAILTATGGSGQSDTAGTLLPIPFTAHVTDAYGNDASPAQVAFTRIAGSGTVGFDTVLVDVNSNVGDTYTLGTIPGTDTIRATLVGTSAFVDYVVTTVSAVPASLVAAAGDDQTQTVNTTLTDTLVARVYSAASVPIAGVPLVWSVIRGGTLDVDTVVSDSLGFVRAIYTLGTLAGTDSVQVATLGGGLTALFTETATAGAPVAISLVGGDAQTDTVGRTLPVPLTAFVGDAYGNAVAGAAVTFTTITGGGTPSQDTVVTNGVGQAFVSYTLAAIAGTDSVRAQLVGTSAFLDFTATAVSGAPAFLNKVLGDNQQDTVFSTLTDSVVVQLVDGSASPVPNTWIYWLTAGATVSADSTLTDGNGRAAVQVTLGGVAVNTFVLARNADTTIAASFSIKAVAGIPTQISPVAGIGQSGVVNTALASDFGAFVQDAYGNPVVGQAVEWTNLAGFAALGLPDTTLTDSVGIAYLTTPMLGAVAGEDSLEAQILGGSATALFTATANVGPVGSLQYVSGTGQSGTVGTLLASQFTVQVLDAASNPISGAWVYWTVVAGNGTFPTDSSLTDGSGVAKITMTLGTLAGIDSAVATVTGTADTVAFYAQANPGAPAALVKVSGDSQSSAVSTNLPAPLVVQATDQYGNPIAGVAVDFGFTSGPGGGFAFPSTTTDAAGLASSGTVNLAATAGSTIADATSPAITTDTVYFTIVALPIGTTRQWIGAVSSDWGDANNWAPASLPTTSDNVYVPAAVANQPVLDVSRTIGGLTVEAGADVNVQGNILTLNGDLVADGTISRSSGHTILAGSSATARGHLGAIQVTGNVTLGGASDATSNFQVTAGSVNVGGQTLTINGDLDISGSGEFVMTSGGDSVQVNGNASWNGSTNTSILNTGVVVLTGDLSVPSGGTVFHASGTHRFVLAGSSPQTIAFASAALGGNQFQDLVLANASGYIPTGDFAVAGAVTLSAGTVNGAGTAFLGGNLSIPNAASWNMGVTDLAGSPAVFPDTLLHDLHINDVATLQADLVVLGNYAQAAGTFTVGGHRLQVDGTFDLSGTAEFAMQSAADTVDIAQGVTWNGNTTLGLLTDGVLLVRGNFIAPSSATFRASGTHTIQFAGTSPQTVQLNNATPGGTQFQNAVFANATSVNFASAFVVAGTSTLSAGTVTATGQRVLLGGDLLATAGTAWSPDTTDFFGTITQLPDSIHGTMMVEGSITLGDSLWVTGDLIHVGGTVTLNGNLLRVDGAMLEFGSAELVMQNANDVLDVGGDVTWQGSGTTGLLTAGSALFRGNFTEPSPAPTYQASGTHTTIFAGTAPQTVTFTGASPAADQMRDLSVNNPAGVTFVNNFVVSQNVNVVAGTVTSANTAIIGGSVTGTTGFDWRPELTRFTGATPVLPDSFPRSVEFAAGATLAQPFKVGGALLVTNGTFDPAGWTLTVDSAFTVSGGAAFLMQNSADSVDIGGAALWNGSTTPGLLTAGVLVMRGDLNIASGPAFQAQGTHRTILAAPVAATIFVNNASMSTNRFQDLEFRGAGSYTLNSGFAVAGSLTKAAGPGISITGSDLRTIETRELALDGVSFDSVQVSARGTQIPSLDNVSFTRAAPDQVTMQVVSGGEAAPKAWTNISFAGTPYTVGKMVQVIDSAEDGLSIVVRMMNSFPLNGEAFESEVGSNQPAIDWTRLVFADQPVNGLTAAALPTVRVAVLDPAGDTLTSYGNAVTLGIGTNPAGGTLGGTTTQPASSGIASFGDLTIDNPGFGYTLTAGTADLPTITSATFDITAPLPVGFTTQWYGTTSTDWNDGTNWSTGTVPTASDNVYISSFGPNDPSVINVTVNRLWVDSGATLTIPGAAVTADSSVEVDGNIAGGATLLLTGTGDLRGNIDAFIGVDGGTYTLTGPVNTAGSGVSILNNGHLTVGADTLTIGGSLATNSGGVFEMNDAAALVDVGSFASFFGASTTGTLTAGTLRISGDLSSGGVNADAFAPSGGLLTVLNGTGVQTVNFAVPDSVSGSHFGRLQVSTAGKAFLLGRYDAMGDLLITNGATLEDSLVAGFEAHGFTTVDAGGTLDVNNFRTRGGLGVAVGATYSVATTTYYGGGSFPINPAPYDTLVLQLQGQASGDFAISGDLRLTGTGAGFDLNGHTVSVGRNVDINNGANLTMVNAADVLNVAGSFFTNGDSTVGRLTDGLLQIAGSFHQSADGSGESFRASGNHTTRFTGGAGLREIKFDSPSMSATDLGGSHFAILDLPDGVDTMGGRVAAAVSVSVGGSVTYDTAGGGNELASYGPMSILASSDSVHLQALETWGGLSKAGAGLYSIGATRLYGGSGTLPALPYIDLAIAYTGDYTLGADQVVGGVLTLGIYCSEICTSQPGKLTVGGHALTTGNLQVMGLGKIEMATGDSVDVNGSATFRSTLTPTDLAGGTLVVRGLFNEVGTDAFQADAAHRTVLSAIGTTDIYTVANSWFGKLYILDAGERRIRTSEPLVVLDSLVLGTASTAVTDTFGFGTGSIVAQGPVLTVNLSSIQMDGSVRFNSNSLNILGNYSAVTTYFGGTGQTIPAIPLQNVGIEGTVQLGAPLDIGGNNLTINGNAGPADLDLNGFSLAVSYFGVSGQGTLTSTTPGSGLLVRSDAVFNGGDETGKLTEGGITVWGNFTQDSLTSLSSYVSSGNHTTVFADSSFGGSQAVLNSMTGGQSRFNHLTVYGNGVTFFGDARIDGVINMLDPLMGDSVRSAQAVRIAGTLNDPNNFWKVDTTVVVAASTIIPDSIERHLTFETDFALTHLLGVGGIVTIRDTMAIGGYTLRAHNSLIVEGAGLLQMTNPTDDVSIDGVAVFEGAVSTGLMTEGRLTLGSNLVTGNVTPGSFDPTGNHVTVVTGSGTNSLSFVGGPQGYGPNQLVVYTPYLDIPFGMKVKGTFRDSVELATLNITSTSQLLDVGQMEMNAADLTDVLIQMGDQSALDTATFHYSTVQSGYALTVTGPGRATPLDLHALNFPDYAQTGILLAVGDTVSNGTGIDVRMFGSTPFDGSSKQLLSGLDPTTATWSHLAFSSPFPATVDSVVPFNLSMVVKEPDGSNRNDVIGTSVEASLLANPGNVTLNGSTSNSFDGQSANLFGLHVDTVGTGLVLHVEVQGRPIDFVEATFDAINPAPAGAVIFTGAVSTDWTNQNNWSTTSVPSPAEDVFIPGGTSVVLPPSSTYSVNTLVLGSGANLDLGFGSTLTVNGNAYAGQTITGSGSIVIAGGASQVSGTFPTLTVTGSVSAVGRTTITGDLIIDGTGDGAEFNVGGQKVDVSNTLFTQNGGLLTMDGAADTLYVSSASFAGGNEFGRLTDGVLIVQGSNFDQGFGDANSFMATGNHTTIFADGGSATAVNITTPANSQFATVKVQNPNGVDFNESGLGRVRMVGNLDVTASGVVTGDTLEVFGHYFSNASSSLTLNVLKLVDFPVLAGTYTVGTTWYSGPGVGFPGAPQGYQTLRVSADATITDTVGAQTVIIDGGGRLNINARTLRTGTLYTNAGLGALVMDDPADSVIVTGVAHFNGTTPAIPMTAGYLEIQGDLEVSPNWNAFVATAGHVTRFAGAPVHTMNFPGEGNATPLGTLVIDSGTVLFNDPSLVTGDLILHGGQLADSSQNAGVVVQGSVLGDNDASTELLLGRLTLAGTLDWQGTGAHYQPTITAFNGTGQVIPQLPYAQVVVSGTATLGADQIWDRGTVDSTGSLTMGGHRLVVGSGGFLVTDDAHFVMQDPADTLNVAGTATFSTDANTTGDYTAGGIRAAHFLQVQGSFGGTTSFVQLAGNRIVPQAGDTIEMTTGGQAGSMLKTLVLNGTGGPVYTTGPSLWIADSLVIVGGADSLVGATGSHVIVGFPGGNVGTLAIDAGTIAVDTLGVAGPLSVNTGTYAVALTKFLGAGQTIPAGVAYQDIEVQYAAALGGDLSLPDRHFTVGNSGSLDMSGFNLTMSGLGGGARFETQGSGVLVMDDPADSLTVTNAKFGGGDETGLLTDGVLRIGNFQQVNGFGTINTFVASGTHLTEFINLGLTPEGGYNLQMDPDAADTASHFNDVSFLGTAGVDLSTNVYAAGAVLINNTLNGQFYTLTAAGPVTIGTAADVTLDTLRVLGTLSVDPSATVNIANTVFGPAAAPIPTDVTFNNNVFIEGAQTLTAPLSFNGDLYVRGGGVLTPAGYTLSSLGTLFLQDNAHLVMTSPEDTVDVAQANFNGAASTSDLAGGMLRIRNGLVAGNSTSDQSFAPSGTMTEFYGGGSANIDIAAAAPSASFIDSLRVIGGTTISPQSYFLVMGPAVFKDGSTLDGNSSSSALDFRGKVSVLDTSIVNSTGSATLFFYDSLTMNTPGSYNVANTNFYNTDGIPDLPYQYLTMGDGVHLTLTHPLTAINQLILTAGAPGTQDLVLNGHKVTTADFSVGSFARFTMDSIADTLEVSGPVLLGGADLTGLLTKGVFRVGGSFTQNSSTSVNSFVSGGTLTEFFGTGTHAVTFANTAPGLSHFARLAVLDGGTLQPHSSITAMGGMTVDTSSTFDGTFMTGSHNAEFYGKVNILDGGIVQSPGLNSMFFHDSLIVAPTGSYSAFNTVFQGTDGIPDVNYTHIYLRQGVHLTLTHRLTVFGGFNVQNDNISGNPADTVTIRLNGHKITANGLGIIGYGRFTMDSIADTLEVFQDVTWRGVDQDTSLTKGVIRIGRGFAQNGQFSARSFAPAGTRVEFYGPLTHQASFTDPGTGASHFADLSVADAGTLSPFTMMTVMGSTTIGSGAHFDGQLIPLGSVVDFFGPVTVQSGGDFHASTGPANFNFYGNSGLTVLPGASVPYDVLNTGFVNNSNIPNLPYKNLFLAGRDSIISGNVTADSIVITDFTYVGPGRTLASNGNLIVDGGGIADQGILKLDDGTVTVADSFITQNAGYLISGTAVNSLSANHVFFNGGNETTRLTRGTLTVGGNFASGAGTSFDADSLFTVNFTGGGNHDLFLGNTVSQHFGNLQLTASAPESDTLTLSSATFSAYKLTATGNGRLTSLAATLQVEGLNVSGLADSGVAIDQYTLSAQPLTFDGVTFRGFASNVTQLRLTDNGGASAFDFLNVDFDDAAAPDGINGFFLRVEDNDGASPDVFLLNIYGPDAVAGPSNSNIVSGTVTWFPPT